ncbi:MAG: hypothetical protein J0M29_14275 [Chitinophagales bacterium]|nr:hypothetical protein [Chitinophagales bacterium]
MKLLHLLRLLDAEDQKSWERFLESPYFKAPDRFLIFYRQLKKKHPAFDPEKPELKAVYESCFGKNTYSDAKLYNLMSDMARQLERFLALEVALGPVNLPPTSTEEYLLISALGQRNAGAYFREEAEAFTTKLKKQQLKAPEDWYFLFKTFEQVYFNPDTPKSANDVPYLEYATENLLHQALSTYLRFAAEWMSRVNLLGPKKTMPYLNRILKVPGIKRHIEQSPMSKLYLEILLAKKSNYQAATFERLVSLFHENLVTIPLEDQKTMLRQIINYGIRTQTDDPSVGPSLLAVYKDADEFNILLDNGRMPQVTFLNIVIFSANLEEFDYVNEFITKFSPFLDEAWREPVIQLAQATIHYYLGELEEAHSLILNNEIYKIPGCEFNGKNLLLKITLDRYLLLGKDEDFLFSRLENIHHFINRKTNIADHRKNAMLNYFQMIGAIAKSKRSNAKDWLSEQTRLLDQLETLKPVSNKSWLIARIQMLK